MRKLGVRASLAAGVAGFLVLGASAADDTRPPAAVAVGVGAAGASGVQADTAPAFRPASTNAPQRVGLLALYDTNGDGKVAKEEYLAAMEKRFAVMDTNRDGVLTADELTPRGRAGAPHGRMSVPAERPDRLPVKSVAAPQDEKK